MASKKRTKYTKNQLEYIKNQKRIKNFIKRANKKGFYWEDDKGNTIDLVPKIPKRVTKKALNEIKKVNPKSLYKKAKYFDDETGEITTGEKGRTLNWYKSRGKSYYEEQDKKEIKKLENKIKTNKATKEDKRKLLDIKVRYLKEYIPDYEEYYDEDETEQDYNTDYKYEEPVYNTGTTNIPSVCDIVLQNMFARIATRPTEQAKKLRNMLNKQIKIEGKDNLCIRLLNSSKEIIELCDIACFSSDQTQIDYALNSLAQLINGDTLSFEDNADFSEYEEY